MQFSDTTNKSGLVQDCEFWTNLGDGTISGDSSLLARFTGLMNASYARTLGRLQLISPNGGAEDTNYTSQQFSFFDIVLGQNDYDFTTDEVGNTITDITGVLIQPNGSSDYKPLDRLSLTDRNALLIMSPNATQTGTPRGYIEKNGIVFLDVLPDYGAANGGKVFYRLVPSYFTTADTNKKPGFVEGFHRIVSLDASHDWLIVNKPDNAALLTRIESELQSMNSELADYIRQKNPTSIRITGRTHSSR
jgi:hypothetical protein